MKKVIKPLAVLASAFIVGSTLSTGAFWSDKEEMDYSGSVPHARLDLTMNGQTQKIIQDDGTLTNSFNYSQDYDAWEGTPYVEADFLTNDEIIELGTNHKVAKPITIDAQTYGEIGLTSYKLTWNYQSMYYGFTESTGAQYPSISIAHDKTPELSFTRGSLLTQTDPTKNRIVDVEDPAECTTDILNEEMDHTSLLEPHYYSRYQSNLRIAHPSLSHLEELDIDPASLGIGENERKLNHLCVVLAMPESTNTSGIHENTVTAEGSGTISGEKTSDSDTFSTEVEKTPIDYTDAMQAQLNEEFKIALTSSVSYEVSNTIYTPGNFSYLDFQDEE